MCGIAGIIGSQGKIDPSRLTGAFLRALAHRGPDDQGWLVQDGAGVHRGRGRCPHTSAKTVLVHTRLSILDLSDAGWQPMGTADDRYFIVYNGEIYNYLELRGELEALGHVLHSNTDTEVLLHACAEWGPATLNRLVGMFAFALLDTRERRLFLARDFFGIKPLYYTRTAAGLAFASEIKALLVVPGLTRRVNPTRLFEYLRFGRTDHHDETLFAGIHQLPAAHYLEVSLDHPTDLRLVRYWQADLDSPLDLSFAEATEHVRGLFLNNVRLHLRSDVAVGAALSGGIDSSAIVGAMRQLEPGLSLHAFSYVADDPALSEERWMKLAGSSAGAVLHRVQPTPDELVADLDRLIDLQDEPFASTSIYAQYRVFRLAREAGITVMLDGQGADEMLAGYRWYVAARLGTLLRRGRFLEAARFLRRATRLPGTGGMARVLLQALGLLVPSAFKATGMKLTGNGLTPRWLNAAWFRERGLEPQLAPRVGGANVLRGQLHRTLVETSLPMLLRYEDRNSMSQSIESRVPFLTVPLVDFVLRLPEEYLISRDGTSKSVFRQAMRGLVPDAVLDRRDKIGFVTPEQSWLATLRPWVDQTLRSEAVQRVPALKGEAVRDEWQAVLQGRRPFDFRVWRWLNLIRWAERFDVGFDS